MGIDRFEDSAEDPSQKADGGARRDTDRSEDARPSGEVPQSGDAPRPGDPTPDRSPRESPDMTDTETTRAETRTRDEYADHVRLPGSPPVEGDSPKHSTEEPTHSERGRSEATQLEEERSESPQEDRQGESPTRVPSDLEGSAEKPSSPEDAPAYPANLADAHDKPDDEDLQAPGLSGEVNPDALAPESDNDDREPPEETTSDDNLSGAQDDDLGGLDNDAAKDQLNRLTDREWAEHLDEVRDGLDTAREAGLRTTQLHTIDGKGQIWSEERDLRHEEILEEIYAKAADVPCDHKAIMAGGLGGAGKTTVLTGQAGIDLEQYLMINPDDFKEGMARRGMLPEIEGLSPMEASDLAHEESSYLALQLALRAQADGRNIIWDITMSTEKSTEKRINDLHTAGYTYVEGLFVDIPIETSLRRTESRHRHDHEVFRSGEGLGGRYIPPEVIKNQEDPEWGSRNKRTFEALKERFNEWSIYDNSVERRPATLIDSSRTRHAE
jgi:predicted ABC-type ATPase